MKLTLRVWRPLRYYVRRHASDGWNPLKNKKILAVYALVFLPLLAIGGGVYAQFGGAQHASSASDINLQKGLVGWWQLNGNAKDQTPYANNGTVTGASLTTDRKAKANSAYSFNGTTSDIGLNNPSQSKLSNGTISAWIKTSTSDGTFRGIVVKQDAYGMFVVSGRLFAYDWGASSPRDTGVTVADGNWHLVTMSFQSGVTNGTVLYVDGTAVLTTTITVTDQLQPLYVGYANCCGQFMNGSIDDARVYNRVISTAEVKALYKEYDPGVKAAAGENGLIGWWKMIGNAKDASPYGNNLSVTSATLSTDRKAEANKAYSFNGTSSYLSLASYSALSPGANSYTISAWIKTGSNGDIVNTSNSNWGSMTAGYGLVISGNWGGCTSNGHLLFAMANGTSQDASLCSTSSVMDNNWHHIAVVVNRSTNTQTFYVDGLSNGSITNSFSGSVSNTRFTVGQSTWAAYFSGSMDDLRIYNRALSATEISNLYGSYSSEIEVSNLQAGLVGEWDMNGNAKDATPYGDNGTVNLATLTTDRKGRANSAYSFNGSSNYIVTPSINLSNTNVISVSFWMYWNSYATETVALELSSDTNTHSDGFMFDPASSQGSGTQFEINVHGNVGNDDVLFTRPSTGTWHHYVAIFNKGASGGHEVAAVYVDGVSQSLTYTAGNMADNTNNFGSEPLYIMSRGGTAYFSAGKMDDIRVWNRALNSTEAAQLYTEYR